MGLVACGGIWVKESKKGNQYLSISVNRGKMPANASFGDMGYRFLAFVNKKKDKETSSDYIVYMDDGITEKDGQ